MVKALNLDVDCCCVLPAGGKQSTLQHLFLESPFSAELPEKHCPVCSKCLPLPSRTHIDAVRMWRQGWESLFNADLNSLVGLSAHLLKQDYFSDSFKKI